MPTINPENPQRKLKILEHFLEQFQVLGIKVLQGWNSYFKRGKQTKQTSEFYLGATRKSKMELFSKIVHQPLYLFSLAPS